MSLNHDMSAVFFVIFSSLFSCFGLRVLLKANKHQRDGAKLTLN